MKANELRIGNWVKLDLIGTENQVTQILERGVNCGSIGVLYEMVKPIPLTEEWLERFGFENSWLWRHKDVYFNLLAIGDVYYYTADDHHHTSEAMRYVHQLQNLYFALTGEEITVKE